MNWRYIKKEAAAILALGACAAMLAMLFTAGIWWTKPGLEILIMLIAFAVGALIGLAASIHDDWKVSLKVERRQK